MSAVDSRKYLGKISAQPHTIVKQIYFPNGNVLFLSLFSLFKNWMHNVVWGCTEILPISDRFLNFFLEFSFSHFFNEPYYLLLEDEKYPMHHYRHSLIRILEQLRKLRFCNRSSFCQETELAIHNFSLEHHVYPNVLTKSFLRWAHFFLSSSVVCFVPFLGL